MFSSYLLQGALTMIKILFALSLLFNFVYADYLNSSSNECISRYWYSGGKVYVQYSSNGSISYATNSDFEHYFYDGFEYNSTSKECQKISKNNTLGLSNEDFNYLNAFLGFVIFGLFMVGLFL